MPRRPSAVLALILLAGGLSVGAAEAQHCRTDVVVYSRHWVDAMVTSTGAFVADPADQVCKTSQGELTLRRTLLPGTNQVMIRYERDLGESVPALTAWLDGQGFNHAPVVLERKQTAAGFVYATDFLDLPGGPVIQGSLGTAIRLPARRSACPSAYVALPHGCVGVVYHALA